jgi:hypothetical protein
VSRRPVVAAAGAVVIVAVALGTVAWASSDDAAESDDVVESDLRVPSGCYEVGGGFEFHHTEAGSAMAFKGTDYEFQSGQVAAREGPLSALPKAEQDAAYAAREAAGWDTEHLILLNALSSATPIVVARAHGSYDAQDSDADIRSELAETRRMLLDAPRC